MNKIVLLFALIGVLIATSCGRRHDEYPERDVVEDAVYNYDGYYDDTCAVEEVYDVEAVEVTDSVAW